MIRIKRVYETASPSDGSRFLVERLWPRGMKKEALRMDGWLRDVAPSPELRKWYGHDPAKWSEFQRRYRRELDSHSEACRQLVDIARRGPLTLLYSASDTERNSALVLKDFLQRGTAPVRAPRRPASGRRSEKRKS
ncbi:MAG: DUF488 domain-containing protein [Acidobacteriota bacterium]|nr:DUF488 domain-containing protein [Acidobacteriota bacterium]